MNQNTRIAALALGAVLAASPLAGLAQGNPFVTGGGGQGAQGGGSARAWTQFKLDPNKTVQLTFRNASVDSVLELFSRVSGITIVKDPALNTPITVTSPRAVKLNDAFEILNAAIGLRGFEMVKDGNLLLIRRRQERQGGGFDPAAMAAMMGTQTESQLKVYRIKFANASEVARIVNDVFAQQQQAQNPFAQMFGGMGGGAARFGGGNQRGGQRGTGGMGGFGSFNLGGMQPQVRASSDDFSNSVIVNAPRTKQFEVEALIEEIDKQTESPLTTKIYTLSFAAAAEVVPVIQNILNSNTPTGRGGASQNQPLSQRFTLQNFLGNRQQGAGTVTADDRTNSLVVSATADNQKVVVDVLKEIDKEVSLANTTFVFPISNARADQIADLLNNAFGGRAGSGQNRGGTTQRNNTQNRNTGNRNNTGGFGGGGAAIGGGGGGRAPVQADPNSLPLQFEENQVDDGVLMTDIFVQQGGFGGFGGFRPGGQGRTTQNQSELVRGADGRLQNSRDLTGQVTVIPDPNTNSLIVVTNPDNVELIRQILAQLDRIPEQVMIETLIVEATLDNTNKLGVEWQLAQPKAFGNTGTTGNLNQGFGLGNANPALEGFRYTLAGGNFSAFLNALQTDNKFQVLSTPRIFTSNNVQAQINISQSVPYVLSTRQDANGALTFNYAFQDVGIVLTVTPQITSNGYVRLEVSQTANDLQGFTDFNAPIVNQRQAETTVSVKDGETIVLGGIMRSVVTSNVKKLPLLGDIPILGNLFRSTTRQNTKTELMVFLTPRVVRNQDEADGLKDDTIKGLSPSLQQQIRGAKVNSGGAPASKKQEKGNKPNQ